MGSRYSVDHIAEDDIHTDITTRNIKEPQHMYRLGTSSNRLLGGGGSFNMFYWIRSLALCFCSGSKIDVQ